MSLNPHLKAGKLRPLFCRTVALVSIAALIMPSVALIATRTVRAASPSTSVPAPPMSAPPQPFHVGTATEASIPLSLVAFEANLIGWTASLFETEPPPKEFSGPKAATFSENVTEKLSSVLGLITPSLATKREEAPLPAVLPSQPAAAVDFDFDGDGKSDLSRWHPGTTEFKIHNSNGGSYSTYSIGSSSAKLAPADYDGDGKTDVAFFAAGTWTIRNSSTGSTTTVTAFGQSGDVPVSGNYGGSSTDDLAVYRPSTGYWYWREVGNSTVYSAAWGASGDIPTPGDYDGDGKMDFAVHRPSDHNWYIYKSASNSYDIVGWGNAGDIPVPADFDGDGKTDLTMYRPSTGEWWSLESSTSYSTYTGATWGNYGDQPLAGDFDGDGKADIAIWRPTTGYWFVYKSASGTVTIEQLGTEGDTAAPSSYVKQIGGGLTPDQISQALLSPRNATGGTNLYSQNFSWGTSLVSLPGRAGLDLGLGISYNSLIWTKVGSAMVFDDSENITPGFTLDFPKIEAAFYDDVTDRFVYMMVTQSGGREAFRQTTVSNVYETYDSTYAQLTTSGASSPNDPPEGITIKVKSTDGTTLDYSWSSGAYRCTKVTDRNGNYIALTYTDNALVSITDTLGRVVTINYSAPRQPSSITQTWKDSNGSGSNVTHSWASFSYTTKTLATDFDSSLTVIGPPNGTVLNVLDRITYADGSSTKFYYNDYAQVWKIENIAADSTSHVLNRVRTNLESPSAHQTDCPRFTDTYNWVENFNQDSGGTPQETHVTNSITTGQTYSLPGSLSGTATKIEVSMASDPYNSLTKTFVSPSGWSEGLPIATEDWADGTSSSERKRWTYTAWTQENTSAAYLQNPRVTETRVGDASNVKRTTIDYLMQSGSSTVTQYGLTSAVKVYDTDLSTVLKTQTTTYNLDSAYTSRRIIGLPAESDLWNGTTSGTLMSKVTYAYDEEDFSHEGNQNISSVIEHDNTNYSSSFYVGRGNITSSTRWDANSPTNSTYAVTSRVRYDIAGSPVAKIDPLNRKVTVDYTDNYNDTTTTRNTYAYPKYLTDPAGNSSTIKYRFDIGANVWALSPNLNSTTAGKESTREFDSIGRLSKETIVNSGAYTRYEYPTNDVQSKVYSTIVDTNSNGADSADEVLSESWADGTGRVRMSRTEHPNSTGGWSGTLAEYDILGRVKRSSVPTEISVSGTTWTPAGDDASRGWVWNSGEYDWKGRTTRTIPSDSTGSDGKDTLISYDGCGCAGGQVTTIQGENIVETDWSGTPTSTLGRRTQKIYEDILGRDYKTEVYNWDGSTVYATTVNSYNGRDQITNTRQYAGSTTSGTYRDVTMTYDGFGRMATRHYPIEDASANTSWTYNTDDSINTVTDPRGVVTNFSYYSTTGLLHQITYDVPSGLTSTVPDTPDVTFGYNNVGNRTSMSDGTGSASYVYNSLTQMTSETKSFTGLSGSFTIDYTYTLAGGLKTMSDPQNSSQSATYSFDKIGRATGVSQALSGSNVSSIHDTLYRAWGGVKEYRSTSGTGTDYSSYNYSYDSRLNVNAFLVGTNTYSPISIGEYDRYADGMIKRTYNTNSIGIFDRSFAYDHVGRLVEGLSGHDASGSSSVYDTPYKNEISFNAFSDTTQVSGQHWGRTVTTLAPTIGTGSGRINGHGYDAAGDVTSEGSRTMTFDAAERNTHIYDPLVHTCCENNHTYDNSFDGDGQLVKEVNLSSPPSGPSTTETDYNIRSTVLGGETIGKMKTYDWTSNIGHQFITPINGVKIGADVGYSTPDGMTTFGPNGAQLDTRGSDVGEENPYNTTDGSTNYPAAGGDPTNYSRCAEGGLPMSCDKQARFERRAEQIFDQIAAQEAAKRVATTPASTTGHEGLHSRSEAGSVQIHATTSTGKPASDPQTAGAVSPASIPMLDPSAHTGLGGPSSDDYPSIGEFSVQSEPANDPIVDASQGMDQRGTKLSDRQLRKIANDIQLIFDKNPGCEPYINGILQHAETPRNPQISQNFFDTFWAIRNQNGFSFVENLGKGGYALGSVASGNAGVELLARSSSIPGLSRQGQAEYARGQELLTALAAIGETIHLSGAFSYNDIEMSLATAEYNKVAPPNYGTQRPPPGQSVPAWISSWSGYWHPQVDNHCLIRPLMVTK